MSINGEFRQVSPRALEVLTARPELIGAALKAGADQADPAALLDEFTGGNAAVMLEQLPEAARQMVMQQMEQMRALMAGMAGDFAEDAAELEAAGIVEADLPEGLNIRKGWHPLHYLLCGEESEAPWPLGAVVLGGQEVGDELVYGPARVLTPAQVAELAGVLQGMDEEALMVRYVPGEMEAAGISPCGWEDPEEDEERREWVRETFRQLRDYYADAKERGYGMILALT